MDYEVELKFPLADSAQLAHVERQLKLQFEEAIEQVDRYFAHPSRDFSATDEAFRLRQVGLQNFVTYKGPRIDRETKTRKELELALPPGTRVIDDFTAMWEALGFLPVGTVAKKRRKATLNWRQRVGELVHDDVSGLGQFLEIEFVCGETELESCRQDALALAESLSLESGECRSYLELLLAQG